MTLRTWQFEDSDRWHLCWNDAHLAQFIPSYTGNGTLGTRFGGLILEWDARRTSPFSHNARGHRIVNPLGLFTLSRHIYDEIGRAHV